MSKFFLFYIITWLTRNPLLALLIVLALWFFLDRRFIGLIPDFSGPFRTRREIRRLKREVMLNPHNAQALSDLGRDLIKMKRHQEGIQYLEKATEKMSDIAETQFYLGVGYLNLNRLEQAGAHLEKAIALDPRFGYGEAHLRLGDVRKSQNDLDGALAGYEAFTAIHTSSSEGFYKIGEVCLQRGDRQRARESFQNAVNAFRGSPSHKKRIDRPWFWKAKARLSRNLKPAA